MHDEIKFKSYFNPFNSRVTLQAQNDYKELNKTQKVISLALGIFTGLVSIPLLGLPGLAVYRAVTHGFASQSKTDKNENKENVADTPTAEKQEEEEREKVKEQIEKTNKIKVAVTPTAEKLEEEDEEITITRINAEDIVYQENTTSYKNLIKLKDGLIDSDRNKNLRTFYDTKVRIDKYEKTKDGFIFTKVTGEKIQVTVPEGHITSRDKLINELEARELRKWFKNPENTNKIKEILLYNQNLEKLPPEVFLCTEIERLNLSNNQFTSLPAEIGNFKKLKTLNLHWNKNLSSLPENLQNRKDLEITTAGTKIT